jgi:hypothetical protein
VERKNSLKQNKIGHLKIKNCKFERDKNLKYLGVILNEDNNYQVDMQERIKNADKTYFMLQKCFKNKTISKIPHFSTCKKSPSILNTHSFKRCLLND